MKFAHCLITLLIFSAFSLPSCKKSDNGNSVKTISEYITQKPWILTGYRVNTGEGNENWKTGNVTQCNVDDIYTFYTNYTFVLNGGNEVCSHTDPIERTGSWSFLDNSQTIKVNGTYFNGSYSLNQIDDRKMVLVNVFQTFKQEFTFTHP